MDPITISAILAGLTGAVSAKAINEFWDQGKKWISNYYKDHNEKIRENAEKNALSFLNDLAQQVQLIENSIKDSEKAKELLEKKLNNPDFAASLQTALIASARTSSEYKHKILSRAIEERLKNDDDNVIDLSCSMAVNSIPYLAEKHLNMLGAMTVLVHMRPEESDLLGQVKAEQFHEWYTNWLAKQLSWLPEDFEISYIDCMHLMSTSCINYGFIGHVNLEKVLVPNLSYQKTNPWSYDQFIKTKLGMRISKWWDDGLHRVHLTSIGQLIGAFVVDNKLGTKTKIDWI